ncbi:lipoyl(octanoyl) transferase [Sphaceloma murrayae]|uniref:Octanoyltransferase n=1 Tax=Sphaceloma murrayae TaxID=2082308 RepID=A0A2K1QX73_9PEZI|nr:lipoyl(octanoyl) transferase [Sphaceloma murrayae]
MNLRHLHLPGLTPYTHASALQSRLVSRFLAHKANPHTASPDPVIITAQFHPVYTCGRREIGTVSAEQQAFLRADGQADFHEALRGGQTTFHGPGQLIAYPILDLKRHALTPRSYVCLLEKSLMGTCKRYGVETRTTEHPGVWVDEERKIAALGVHLRRNVSSHGVGLNVSTDLGWFGRIVACGLEGKSTTSLQDQGVNGVTVEDAGKVFVEEMAGRLGGVDSIMVTKESEVD